VETKLVAAASTERVCRNHDATSSHFVTTAEAAAVTTSVRRQHSRGSCGCGAAVDWKLADRVSEWRHLALPTTACAGRYIKQHCRVSLRSTHAIINTATVSTAPTKQPTHLNHFDTPCHNLITATLVHSTVSNTLSLWIITSYQFSCGFTFSVMGKCTFSLLRWPTGSRIVQ